MSQDVVLILSPEEAEVLERVLDDAVRSGKLLGLLKSSLEDQALIKAMVKLRTARGPR
jgi:hypothetical protein